MSRFSWRQETNDRSDTGRSKLKFVICGFSLPMTNGNAFPILPYSVLEQTLGSRRSKLGFCRQVPVLQMRELSLRIYCSATYSSFNPAKLNESHNRRGNLSLPLECPQFGALMFDFIKISSQVFWAGMLRSSRNPKFRVLNAMAI